MLFAVGLSVYLWDINKTVAMPVILITLLAALFHIVTALLSLVIQFCPYSTTIGRFIHPLWIKFFASSYTRNFLSALITLPLYLFGILNAVQPTRISYLFRQKQDVEAVQPGSEPLSFLCRCFLDSGGPRHCRLFGRAYTKSLIVGYKRTCELGYPHGFRH